MEVISLYVGLIFIILGALFVIPLLVFIYKTSIKQVEDVLSEGPHYFSQNVFLAGQGVLHFASILMFDWYAKRYNLYQLRNKVPLSTRRLFIIYYLLFMLFFTCIVFMFVEQYL